MSVYPNIDPRPPFGMWAPGNYLHNCVQCKKPFIGDKRATSCADCAYLNKPLRHDECTSIGAPTFNEEKEIREGKRDAFMPGFEVLTGWLQRVPLTWLPSLLIHVVSHCVRRKVFKDTEALIRTVRNIAENEHPELR